VPRRPHGWEVLAPGDKTPRPGGRKQPLLQASPRPFRNADNRSFVVTVGQGHIGLLRRVVHALVLIWYHVVMAMNLRVPEDLDRRLDQLAAEEHTSKSALLLQGAELVLQRHRRSREIGEGLDFVMSHDAELLTRLEDA